ncbi:hypothetical protein ABGB07_32080 [Micromonosporaceae bacterium B7E4]
MIERTAFGMSVHVIVDGSGSRMDVEVRAAGGDRRKRCGAV